MPLSNAYDTKTLKKGGEEDSEVSGWLPANPNNVDQQAWAALLSACTKVNGIMTAINHVSAATATIASKRDIEIVELVREFAKENFSKTVGLEGIGMAPSIAEDERLLYFIEERSHGGARGRQGEVHECQGAPGTCSDGDRAWQEWRLDLGGKDVHGQVRGGGAQGD